MTKTELIRFINELERDLPVQEWRLRGVRIWPMVRMKIGYSPLQDIFDTGQRHAESADRRASAWLSPARAATRIARSVRARAGALRERLVLERFTDRVRSESCDVLVLTKDLHRVDLGGFAYNKLSDPFVEQCRQRQLAPLVLEFREAPQEHGGEPYNRSTIAVPPALRVRGTGRADAVPWEGYDELLRRVDQASPRTAQLLQRGAMVRFANGLLDLRDRFESILEATRARALVVHCYYSFPMMAACAAARSVGIPSIDVQHGVMDATHVAYGSWADVPAEGYELLPKVFAVWGDREEAVIRQWTERSSAHRPEVTGNEWLRFWSEGGPLTRGAEETAAAFFASRPADTRYVLLSLQPLPSFPDFLPAWVYRALDRLPDGWCCLVRLHPRQRDLKHRVDAALRQHMPRADWEIDFPSDAPLPLLLKRVDSHLTYSSSVVLEAAEEGVRSVVCSDDGAAMYPDLIRSEVVSVATSETELIEQILRTERTGSAHARSAPGRRSVAELVHKELAGAGAVAA